MDALQQFVSCVSPPLLYGGTVESNPDFQRLIEADETLQLLSRFVQDGQIGSLYVIADAQPEEGAEEEGAQQQGVARAGSLFRVALELDLAVGGTVTRAVAFLRPPGGSALDPGLPMSGQLQVMTLHPSAAAPAAPRREESEDAGGSEGKAGGGSEQTNSASTASVFTVLQQYAALGFAPLVKARVAAAAADAATPAPDGAEASPKPVGPDGGGGPGGAAAADEGVAALQRKLKELELALAQCQKRLEIPAVKVRLHPEVAAAAARLAAGAGRSPEDLEALGLAAAAADDALLNAVQAGANQWIRDTQKVTRLVEAPFPGSALEEANFWAGLLEALEGTRRALEGPGVRVTVALLNRAKRFVATKRLEEDTRLGDALAAAADAHAFLRGLPLQALLAAPDPGALAAAGGACLDHFRRLKHSRWYAPARAARLLEALAVAFGAQFAGLAAQRGPLALGAAEFGALAAEWRAAWAEWDRAFARFKEFFHEHAARRFKLGGVPQPEKAADRLLRGLRLGHLDLRRRLADLEDFRSKHQRLRAVIAGALADEPGAAQWTGQVEEAYAWAAAAAGGPRGALAVDPDGQEAWEAARRGYEARVDTVDARMAQLLCDRLQAARTAEEMFQVFGRFNPLFFRERVKAAVARFQSGLLKHVRDEVQVLQAKFTRRYEASEARALAELRDLPPAAAKILWARQIERQLRRLVQRTEDVLGRDWRQYAEGRELKQTCDELIANLDNQAFFKKWLADVRGGLLAAFAEKKAQEESYLFRVERDRAGALELVVNFNERTVLLFKEVRNLQYLGFQIPADVREAAETAAQRYPTAAALRSALRAFAQVKGALTEETTALLAPQIRAVRVLIERAFDPPAAAAADRAARQALKWESAELGAWAARLSDAVFGLQEAAEELRRKLAGVDAALRRLGDCPFAAADFRRHLGDAQRAVDAMALAGHAGLGDYVAAADARAEAALARRLQGALRAWVLVFRRGLGGGGGGGGDQGEQQRAAVGAAAQEMDDDAVAAALERAQLASVDVECSVHEVLLKSQVLYLSPPLEHARRAWVRQLHRFLHTVTGLPRLSAARFAVFGEPAAARPATYASLLTKVDPEELHAAYATIERHVAGVAAYVKRWLQFQALWDMTAEAAAGAAGADLGRWQRLIGEARAARATIEAAEGERAFGPIVVAYGAVQAKVNLKYDFWQRELQARFARLLGERVRAAHEALTAAKARLEAVQLEGATGEVVQGVTYVQEMRQRHKRLAGEVAALAAGERLLVRQRYQLPADWAQASNTEGALADFEAVLGRRARAMEAQIPALQAKIQAEYKAVAARCEAAAQDWQQTRPLGGDLAPADALQALAEFRSLAAVARADWDRCAAAKDALGLEPAGRDPLLDAEEEAADLREVWSALAGVWGRVEELKEQAWAAVVPRKLRKALDAVAEALRALPNRVRQYEACARAAERVKGWQAAHPVLLDLKTDALKDRHWRAVLRRLGIRLPLADVTLGHLWDADLVRHRKELGELLAAAQGEQALEEFLRQVREEWQAKDLDLVAYKGRVRLVRGWDDLFARVEEHLAALQSMRQSPYFKQVKEFQEEAALWEDRLGRLRAILDGWVDVQRRWVYLEGIFFGSADLPAQLPQEYGRFKGVDAEFVQLMRKVAQKPQALSVLDMEGLPRQLERQEGLMARIQRALGEYLERQRAAFSRFYFVGDEDLLEIIGNSDEPGKVTAHLGKMFAAVSSVALEGEGAELRAAALVSRDGEEVKLDAPVAVGGRAAKEWLAALEQGMQGTLARALTAAVDALGGVAEGDRAGYLAWVGAYPAQVAILAVQVLWSQGAEGALAAGGGAKLAAPLAALEGRLKMMAGAVLLDVSAHARKTYEQLITELVHQRNVSRALQRDGLASADEFGWLYHLRFYWAPREGDVFRKLGIKVANASFYYGFEYLGIGERLVQTPLTDRCYLTLTQALHLRMGGNPFGPAGTGKTESVKALGGQLGRFVLVFNCDEAFDYGAMGRLFAGLCQVGAWGCFDEFNRLEERILSAVSQQILAIQRGLAQEAQQVDLMGRPVRLHENVGIFVTMNPGYAGRSNLPDNLKQLFRAVAMVVPDKKLIAQVMLYAQGIASGEELAGKIVLLFALCEEQLSKQSHYDFGLRSVKSVLVGAGELKRAALAAGGAAAGEGDGLAAAERAALIRATCNTLVPKLVREDLVLFEALLGAVFPGHALLEMRDPALEEKVAEVCRERHLTPGKAWVEKVLQLKEVLLLRHGVMLVGPSGGGKSTAWRTLLAALERLDGVKGEAHVIDPKALTKEELYGVLDPTTLEWTDGVFTAALRQILANKRGEGARRHWLVFDGDVDPEWAENLNSVLDDNRVLTLPSGERLALPPSVRLLLEVDTLRYATLATVSRCGMVWFSADTVDHRMLFRRELDALAAAPVSIEGGAEAPAAVGGEPAAADVPQLQKDFVKAVEPYFIGAAAGPSSLMESALDFALEETGQVMDATRGRLVGSVFSLLGRGLALALAYDEGHPDFPMRPDHLERFAARWALHAALWGLAGAAPWAQRERLAQRLTAEAGGLAAPPEGLSLLAARVDPSDGQWVPWSASVPRVEIETHRVTASDVVVTTTDTVRHVEVLQAWLASRKPLILCGPPGSGKTMTLTSTLNSMPNLVLAPLNFSSSTTPDLILKTFAQYCEYVRTPTQGTVLQPAQALGVGKWLVVFCDEINLPARDAYGTQAVISFIRQLTEQGGFWRAADNTWVTLRRIQFVGACNPPTDAGRVPMSHRFLRHAPLLLVDFPAEESLKQIYGTFVTALLKLHPPLRGQAQALTDAMVEYYLRNQARFTPDAHPQYIYSPRELSRWVRALHEALAPLEGCTPEELVRLWAHEALRLFHDRLVEAEEKEWADRLVDEVARAHFGGVDLAAALRRPLLYSRWLTKHYAPVAPGALREFVAARLRVFYEEELDVRLVIFDDVLEHALRLDAVLRNPMGHLLLVGESGAGKTVLSKFVAWMNGISIFQIKANNRYTAEQFDEDLRHVMKRVGLQDEKVCFIFDESNALEASFLEQMNALLASGEVPGLFEGEEYAALLSGAREAAAREGALADSDEELFRRFTRRVQRNLHVVFTMNPAGADYADRCLTSPALFNRCVVDWFGTWGDRALAQVGHEFTATLDLGPAEDGYAPGSGEAFELLQVVEGVGGEGEGGGEPTLRRAVVAALVAVHKSVRALCERQAAENPGGRRHFLSPRDYLDLITQFVAVVAEKRRELEEQQLHINVGLEKLGQTAADVAALQGSLAEKEQQLQRADVEANAKLQSMVGEQNEAEKQKAAAEALSAELARQNEEIAVRRGAAEAELAEAEPALVAAKESVGSIKKPQLDEVRLMARPPPLVMKTMEAVVTMLGEKTTDWAEIRKIMRRDNFIPSVVTFDANTLSERRLAFIQEKYIQDTSLEYEAVARASSACGPLYRWLSSQVRYCEISTRVAPLRAEVAELQAASDRLAEEKDAAEARVAALEGSIARYKEEYAEAIRQKEAVKAEMALVAGRVGRAEELLRSLGEEKGRWEASAAGFREQTGCLVGDGLLAAGFLTYAGVFDHLGRRTLLQGWRDTLQALGVPHRPGLGMAEYLSRAADRLAWRAMQLPNDDLCLENAIILERFNRFPLVVDPSGQAVAFLKEKYKERKLVETSFLDAGFMKTLASAIRFGTPLLVQDVETIDPVLNPVLNKELHRTGGRTLIRLGSEEVDFSPKFLIVLTTRNPAARFAPDLCSRVTLVNFTVTPASLQAQALSDVLRAERPAVDARRREVLRLQGEQNVRLRGLEDGLLSTLSEVSGNILDDDAVVAALGTLKREAKEVNAEMAQTAEVMAEVEASSAAYAPLATGAARAFFALRGLARAHFLYRFALGPFLAALGRVLDQAKASRPPEGEDSGSHHVPERLRLLRRLLFEEVARTFGRSLMQEDKLLFACTLAQIYLQGEGAAEADEAELSFLSRAPSAGGGPGGAAGAAPFRAALPQLDDRQAAELAALAQVPSCQGLAAAVAAHAPAWAAWLGAEEPEAAVPGEGWALGGGGEGGEGAGEGGLPEPRRALLRALAVKALRPDRVVASLEAYVGAALGPQFPWRAPPDLDPASAGAAGRPVLLASEPGHDAAGKVDALAARAGAELQAVAMGSAEGFEAADRLVGAAARAGGWVLLRNVHLCPGWLQDLEKRLHTLRARGLHADFRLFLTSEIHPRLPPALLAASDIVVVDAPTGVKANALRFLQSVPAERMAQPPAERNRLYLLLAWLHATVLERLRYAPVGWTKRFEFSAADALCALDSIDSWVARAAGGKAHVDPRAIPWGALRTLLAESVYGGRLDNPFDQALIQSFVDALFRPESFDVDFPLVQAWGAEGGGGGGLVTMPEGNSREALLAWLEALPDRNPPTWLGLGPAAETRLVAQVGRRVLNKLAGARDALLGGDAEVSAAAAVVATEGRSRAGSAAGGALGSPRGRLSGPVRAAQDWLAALPAAVAAAGRARAALADPASHALVRAVARETEAAAELLARVRADLEAVVEFGAGREPKLTNAVRELLGALAAGEAPPGWRAAFAGPAEAQRAEAWVADLGRRLRHLEGLLGGEGEGQGQEDWGAKEFWLGGLFNPEGFMTATRQYVAHAHGWALDELVLTMGGAEQPGGGGGGGGAPTGFWITGLAVEGAAVEEGRRAALVDAPATRPEGAVLFRWERRPAGAAPPPPPPGAAPLTLPVYLHAGRAHTVVEVEVVRGAGVPEYAFRQRGVALIACDSSL